ncbi:hypothetical protein XENOCAPTIV_002356, partial [Xenoophorus captivus]
DSAEYPLVQSGPSARWFHSEFCDFVSVLVAQCQHGVLFDSYLMNSLISLLTELSNSFVRAFRHTCTLAGSYICPSFKCSLSSLLILCLMVCQNRLISMVLDKDNEVAVQTMKLLVLISRLLSAVPPTSDNQDERNEEEEQRHQIFVRLKALLQFYQESEVKNKLDVFTISFKKVLIAFNVLFIIFILPVHANLQLHNHIVYLVDSLWDWGGSLLKDWPTLTAALLQNSPGAGGGTAVHVIRHAVVPQYEQRNSDLQREGCGPEAPAASLLREEPSVSLPLRPQRAVSGVGSHLLRPTALHTQSQAAEGAAHLCMHASVCRPRLRQLQ